MDNNRKDFLKLTGLAEAASFVPISIFEDDNEANAATGGYNSDLYVAIKGSGTVTGIGNQEKENATNFTLGQNFPNPYTNETSIPFQLTCASDVTLYLFDLQGKKVTSISHALPAGDHRIPLDMQSLGLPHENYAYQLEVKNSTGTYCDCKMMTAQQ